MVEPDDRMTRRELVLWAIFCAAVGLIAAIIVANLLGRW